MVVLMERKRADGSAEWRADKKVDLMEQQWVDSLV